MTKRLAVGMLSPWSRMQGSWDGSYCLRAEGETCSPYRLWVWPEALCFLSLLSPSLLHKPDDQQGLITILMRQRLLQSVYKWGIFHKDSSTIPTDFKSDLESYWGMGHPLRPVKHSPSLACPCSIGILVTVHYGMGCGSWAITGSGFRGLELTERCGRWLQRAPGSQRGMHRSSGWFMHWSRWVHRHCELTTGSWFTLGELGWGCDLTVGKSQELEQWKRYSHYQKCFSKVSKLVFCFSLTFWFPSNASHCLNKRA